MVFILIDSLVHVIAPLKIFASNNLPESEGPGAVVVSELHVGCSKLDDKIEVGVG